jgi:hypothetical protein
MMGVRLRIYTEELCASHINGGVCSGVNFFEFFIKMAALGPAPRPTFPRAAMECSRAEAHGSDVNYFAFQALQRGEET